MAWPSGSADEGRQGSEHWFSRRSAEATEFLQRKAMEALMRFAEPTLERARQECAARAREEALVYSQRLAHAVMERGAAVHDPRQVMRALGQPERVRDYASQALEERLRLLRLLLHPSLAARQAANNVWETGRRTVVHYRALDSDRRVGHAARAFAEAGVDVVAEAIATFALIKAVSALPPNRRRIRAMLDRMFPEQTGYGRQFRRPLPRFFFTSPLVRLLAMPEFFGSYLLYREAVVIGQSIEDRERLRETNPGLFESLSRSHGDMRAASSHLGLMEHIAGTSLRPPIAAAMERAAFAPPEAGTALHDVFDVRQATEVAADTDVAFSLRRLRPAFLGGGNA